MAIDLCLYFQVHQPWRLRHYRYLDVGKSHSYFDEEANSHILRRVANKCYLPTNNLIYDLITECNGKFKVSFSISGTAMAQMEAYAPEVLVSFKKLFDTGCAELLSETSHHTLSALYSPEEFKQEVLLHREMAIRHLTQPVPIFRNTELITSNEVAKQVAELGYKAMLMEGADHILRWRSPLFKYRMASAPGLAALLKNYRLSDDIAFRFSDRTWAQWPLTSEKLVDWIKQIEIENPVAARGGIPFLGLFMDYETFGEHQWAGSGIFDFMRAFPTKLLGHRGMRFILPTEAAEMALNDESTQGNLIEAPEPFSWADVERDLSAWRGNQIQDSALRAAYELELPIKQQAAKLPEDHGQELLETWRRLLTSDHFYYMCTKYFADGDVHKYFNPYESPYDAHIIYMNVIADLATRCGIQTQNIA